MRLTLAESLSHLLPYAPPELIEPEQRSRLVEVGDRLPPVTMVGFETDLGTDDASVDLAVAVREGDFETAAGWEGDGSPLAALAAAASDERSTIHGCLGTVWLEYDLSHGRTKPNVLFGLQAKDPHEPFEVALEALRCLFGDEPSNTVRSALQCGSDALPPTAHLFQIGAMVSRPNAGLRLCISRMRPGVRAAYLKHVDWPGDPAALNALLEPYERLSTLSTTAIDAGEAVGPKVGVELYLDPSRRPVVSEEWKEALQLLEAAGLCTSAKHAALLQWPGESVERILWHRRYVRGLNHLKLVYIQGQTPQAKAYFGFIEAPMRTARLASE